MDTNSLRDPTTYFWLAILGGVVLAAAVGMFMGIAEWKREHLRKLAKQAGL